MEAAPANFPGARGANGWGVAAIWIAFACLVLSGAVFARRSQAAIAASRQEPGVAVTSGFEEESFYALWRSMHGRAVYADATRLPFSAAYFNWLFYRAYAWPVGKAVAHSTDAAIPSSGRWITAGSALLGSIALGALFRRILAGQAIFAASLAGSVFFGPLVGWWAFTVRPDVGALMFEATAIAVLLLWWRTRPLSATAASCLLFYGAWSLKQNYVLGLGSAMVFLAYRRQWRLVTIMLLGSIALWSLTFAAMGSEYREVFRALTASSPFYLALGFDNLRDALIKTAPVWILAAGAGWRRGHQVSAPPNQLVVDTRHLALAGLVVSGPLAFAASCKLGASSYYFFTMQVMLTLLAAVGLASCRSPRLPAIGFGLFAVLQLAVLTGRAGRIDLTGQSDELEATWTVWRQEPEPRFSHLTSLNLPWLSPQSPPLVLAFNYSSDRAAGRSFESGGVGGLIEQGFFQSLLLPSDTGNNYDGGSLQRYRRGESVNGLTVFRRVSPPSS